ncbi:exopolysaccharide biosynthesis polyprenyl glycosylphosphotransferase [Gaetbulibacter saemankumensis]|uniref:exopolysaccharide biosynthesis polyprenyl glycosylphosphotransferase n=1 Tax=Gaetbulibacter saemankumensis TaxID=311208 RepID=UPI001FDFA40A|nr:exopolysaccharide biosynthesis polyprenyl glycosylphosphotransferase [Gaetbulibacter saemankumensis]
MIGYDLLVINILAFHFLNLDEEALYFFSTKLFNNKQFLYFLYSTLFWVLISFILKFYRIYRHTSLTKILLVLVKQFFVYSIVVYAFLGIFRSISTQAFLVLKYLLCVFLLIGLIKLLSYYLLKYFRLYLGGNIRNVLIIGSGNNVEELKNILGNKTLGYHLVGHYSDLYSENLSGTLSDSFQYLKHKNSIDEIYCAIDELSENQINDYVKFASINKCNLKFVPKSGSLLSSRLKADYYFYLPVLSIREGALSDDFNIALKRGFDILFSLFVLCFIFSWISIILFVLIKLESKGPLFYKHKRTGINYKEFYCYKFRSLTMTKEIEGNYVKRDDNRVTKIGKFLRKTSLDELPQFFNVLLGEMSVVGPRPHMLSYTDEYSKKIDKYNFIHRHLVKPGITGLAQVKGFRGEIKNDFDIKNRVKYDNFYIENWSILLDIQIIIQTIINIIKGDEKAY